MPSDCVASNTTEENEAALAQMAKVLKADVGNIGGIDFAALARG